MIGVGEGCRKVRKQRPFPFPHTLDVMGCRGTEHVIRGPSYVALADIAASETVRVLLLRLTYTQLPGLKLEDCANGRCHVHTKRMHLVYQPFESLLIIIRQCTIGYPSEGYNVTISHHGADYILRAE